MNLMPRRARVLVVGAGPTGLTLAIRLRQLGVDCLVIDRLAAPLPWSRALGLHARTLEIFHALDVLDQVRRRSTVQTQVTVHNDQEALLTLDLTTLDAPFPWVLSCPQGDVEQVLEERLQSLGGRVWRNTELLSLRQEGEQVSARLSTPDGEHELACSLLVGCDGAHSRVRELLGITFDGVTVRDYFLIADLAIHWDLSPRSSHGFLLPEGSLIALPMPDCWRLIINLGSAEADDEDAQPELTLAPFQMRLAAALGTCPPLGEPRWLSRFTIHRRLAGRYRQNRVFLAGDACHIQSPLGAQGMNTGIGDAFNLAWKLALYLDGRGGGGLLDSYERERRPVARAMLYSVDVLSRTSFARNRLLRAGRDWVLRFMNGRPQLGARLVRRASQLDVAYPDSPLVGSGSWPPEREAPEPGARMPDVMLSVEGEPLRLLDLLRDPRHYLLIQLEATPDPQHWVALYALADRVPLECGEWVRTLVVAPQGALSGLGELREFDVSLLEDTKGEFARRYGEGAALWLMRPDGHLAWRASLRDADQLLVWLRRLRRR